MQKPFQLLKSEVVPLTLDLAQSFRDLTPSPTERPLSKDRLKMLRDKADRDELITFHWAKAKMGDEWLRVNGQHSSKMLADLNGNFPSGLYVHLDTFEVNGPAGLTLLFRQFDAKKSARSPADVSGAYQNMEVDLQELARPVAKRGIEAVTWYRRLIEKVPTPIGDEQYELFHESTLHKYLKWLGEVFSIKTPELLNTAVVAAMYASFERNESAAREFWLHVARGGKDFEENHPTTVLDEWLKMAKEEKLGLAQGEYYRGCEYAWNAFRDDKAIKEIKIDLKKPLRGFSD